MSKSLFKFILGTILIGFSFPVQAAESTWATADQVRARIITSESRAILEMELSEGWHTYWRVPGDAGLPPRFNWSTSTNVDNVVVSWPVPQRFDELGLVTFGYKGMTRLPLTVTRKDVSAPAKLDLVLEVMVCNEICIPQQLHLSVDMNGIVSPQAAIIDSAMRYIPKADGAIVIDTVVDGPEAIVVTATSSNVFEAVDAFVTSGDTAFTATPEIAIDSKDPHRALIRIVKPKSLSSLTGKDVTVVLSSGGQAGEKSVKF